MAWCWPARVWPSPRRGPTGAVGSPGAVSGNVAQAPAHVPVNACGNTINVVGLLNPTFGNTCVND